VPIVEIARFPMFQGCVREKPGARECAPMRWVACNACGSAQVLSLPPVEILYQAGHATGLGAAWGRHHAAFARFIKRHAKGPILDIGGGSGTLAAAYRKEGGDAAWSILEPNALRSSALPRDVPVIEGFLNAATLKRLAPKNIVMCHMLEHAVDLRAAIGDISDALPSDGSVLLAWPDLDIWVKRGLAGALNFEHGIYVTMPRLNAVFAEFGWRASGQEYWNENDTRFIAYMRGVSHPRSSPATSAADAVAAYFAGFRDAAARISVMLDGHDGDALLMPASVYAQALIAAGLDERRFAALLDNAAVKHGARLYGTRLIVRSPRDGLAEARKPIVVLNGGAHDAEIARGLRALRPDIRVLTVQELSEPVRQGLQA
jgi:SAM-dependent methyltransferase